ncbi:ABC transporter ATP-binding protein [Stackebrandtia nassauensis]|uniref:ABC transporter related protein n=1 Tax=Stackebrandtia nassauensis (strain DSM 44728 / CIP 108903 / NRRL B-16338 / NBRC 102104 / LLR-40K-21) TaxID=446470 RepID=D3Q251_STANL|nr:ABC transporter ATP-binding protein [Stackebrandtia nassauensis]ADD41918.1 ABC transporter related protein [Stackebrandtia nassauensis DSM 44728]
MEEIALEATGLSKHYRRTRALDNCTVRVPVGRVSALVGPNGAGKTTLMSLACGLRTPTAGEVSVLGQRPDNKGMPDGVAFLSQDKPLYRGFNVSEMLHAASKLNSDFDEDRARRLVADADVPLKAKVKTLSGGQRTRVALAIALGRRPRLIILDEPLADLDPLARKQVMQTLMSDVAEFGTTVVMSSHVLADLEEVCDHLVLLASGHVQLCDEVENLLDNHRLAVGPGIEGEPPFPRESIVEASRTRRETTLLLRQSTDDGPPDWDISSPSLEELVLAYMRTKEAAK